MRPLVAVPIKPFTSAKGRMAGALQPSVRADLMRETARRVVRASAAAGGLTVVVTGDPAVAEWAHGLGVEVMIEPPGGGLDGAARVAAESAVSAGSVWCVVHGDLPLLTAAHMTRILAAAEHGASVLAPSRTGGTNLLASGRMIEFRYGPGSFSRHLAAFADDDRRVIVTTGTALDIDTPDDLAAAASLPGGSWLGHYLG